METKNVSLDIRCLCGEDSYQNCNEDGSLPVLIGNNHSNDLEFVYFRCTACERAYRVTVREKGEQFQLIGWGQIERPTTRCRECNEQTNELLESGFCISCDFWDEQIYQTDLSQSVRVKGYYFTIQDDSSLWGLMRGFGGAEFTIKFFDGRTITTTNLWFHAEIPERFRDRLADNAEFIGKLPPVPFNYISS